MYTLEYSLPTAETRELMPFEVDEVWPTVPASEWRDTEPMGWEPCPDRPAEACTELGHDDEAAAPLSTMERQLTWLVSTGIGVATLSLVAILFPG